MNETATASAETARQADFVWQRLQEPLRLFGRDFPYWNRPGEGWLVILGVVLALALFYVCWMYLKDSRGVGLGWASVLGLLRITVYALLALVFLLPSTQYSLATETRSKVVVLYDVSGSMHISDDPPGPPNAPPPVTRQDKVIDFLMSPDASFIGNLLKKNPVTVYRFGSRLDDDYLHLADGKVWTRKQREAAPREDGKRVEPDKTEMTKRDWQAWLNPAAEAVKPVDGNLPKEQQELQKQEKQKMLDLVRGTNLGDALRTLIDREQKNQVQGIIVFTDGRSTEGSAEVYRDLEIKARNARMPIFIVGIGEERTVTRIEIRKLRAPSQARPEDTFRVQVEMSGVGLADQEVPVILEVTRTRKKTKKAAEAKGKEEGKAKAKAKEAPKGPKKEQEDEEEEPLPIIIREARDEKNKDAPRARIDLGTKLILRPVVLRGNAIQPLQRVKFRPGTPPLTEADFYIDAASLARSMGVDLATDKRSAGKRPFELDEDDDDTALRFVARVPFHEKETRVFKDGVEVKEHVSEQASTRILKKKLRVLLFASAATRDYQFVQNLLVREMDKERLELAVHLQLPPGETVVRPGVVQSVPKDRLLRTFPETFDPNEKKNDLFNLNAYDVLVCFDPDWKKLSAEQITNIVRWAKTNKTGIVYLGGYFNTVKLASLPAEEESLYRNFLELLPVEIGDRRRYLLRKTDKPWDLEIAPARDVEFMRLDEATDGWKEFFHGAGVDATKEVQRGFYNFYPIKAVRLGSQVLARYKDPEVRLEQNGERLPHPFIVIRAFENEPRTVWIGSTETWRMREYKEEYHERFWTKLVQFAGGNAKGPGKKNVTLVLDDKVKVNTTIRVEVNLDNAVGRSLKPALRPRIEMTFPTGVSDQGFPKPFVLQPQLDADGQDKQDGWFFGDFRLRADGTYRLTLKVPDLADDQGKSIAETITRDIFISPANPELDDTRPDHDRMYRVASEADDVFNRIGDQKTAELKKRLTRPKLETGPDRPPLREDKHRLYFELRNARYIPDCMMQEINRQTSKGGIESLWDDGVTVYTPSEGKPIKISYVLLTVVGLLSVEWLIRKLLRLA
jgi:hypothetical protein